MIKRSKEIIEDYNFHNILKLRIIREKKTIFDTYLCNMFSYYRVPEVDDPDICFFIGDYTADLQDCFVVDGRYHVKQNYIYYENKYKLARWNVEIDGVESDHTKVRIKSNSFGRIVFPGETMYSLIRYKLAQKGYSLIHGSGAGLNNKGSVFSARGGTGKTITAISLVKSGFDYYSDDSVILGDKKFFSFITPFNLRFNYDVEKLLGIHFPLSLRLDIIWKRILYYLTFKKISLFANVHARDIFKDSIKDSVDVSKVFALTQGPELQINKDISRSDITKKLLLNIWFESPELTALQYAYNYIVPKSKLSNYWDNVYSSIYENIEKAQCYEVTLPSYYSQEVFETFYRECIA